MEQFLHIFSCSFRIWKKERKEKEGKKTCPKRAEDVLEMPQDAIQMGPRWLNIGSRWRPEGSVRQSPPRNPRAKVCIFLRFWKGEGHPVWKKPYVLCLPCTGGQDGAQGTVRRAKELKRRVSFCAAKNTLRGHFFKALF